LVEDYKLSEAQKEEAWEKSIELEKIGGRLISLPMREFKSLDG